MKSKKNKSNIRSNIEEGLEINDVDINPLILDYMIRETFSMFDEDDSGDIDKTEFSKLTDALGLEISEKKQAELMRDLDKEGSGCINYEEFVKLLSRFQFGDAQTHLESAFTEYDKDMDGSISLEDFLKVSEELDEIPMTRQDAQLMIAFFKYFSSEPNQKLEDCKVTKREFIATLNKINFLVNKINDSKIPMDLNKSRGSGPTEGYKSIVNKGFEDKSSESKFDANSKGLGDSIDK